jgi:hypothetical protein
MTPGSIVSSLVHFRTYCREILRYLLAVAMIENQSPAHLVALDLGNLLLNLLLSSNPVVSSILPLSSLG